MTTPSRKLRHTAEASLTVNITERGLQKLLTDRPTDLGITAPSQSLKTFDTVVNDQYFTLFS